MTTLCSETFGIESIKLKASGENLTSFGGLGVILGAFDSSTLAQSFKDALPARISNNSKGSYRLGLTQIASFLVGHDCLDDLVELRTDPYVAGLFGGETVVAKTMGNFLRDFQPENIDLLNSFLSSQSRDGWKRIKKIHPEKFRKVPIHLSIDSTSHKQHGVQMEGLAFNYQGTWGLDSQSIFDQYGQCWSMNLRPGNAKSGTGAGDQIRQAFRHFKFREVKYLSADSAYCNQEVMKACLSVGAQFSLTANQGTTKWRDSLSKIDIWKDWIYTDEQIQEAMDKDYDLPEVQVGEIDWRPPWNPVLFFTIVVKRTVTSLGYKYYGVVTNHCLLYKSLQDLMEFHNKRGNVENFIREEKYGFDLLHFPCAKLSANWAFGLLAMVAANLLRLMALIANPTVTPFSKKFRRKFILIPGKLIFHARKLFLNIPKHLLKEVQKLKEGWQFDPEMNPAISTGLPSG